MMFAITNHFKKIVFSLLCLIWGLGGIWADSLHAQYLWKGGIIPQNVANSRGLERQWIAYTDFNPYSKVSEKLDQIIFDRDTIFAITDQGTVQAFEAETGKTKWIRYAKTNGKLIQGLAASKFYLAFTAGSTLFVLNRGNGNVLLDEEMPAIANNPLVLGEKCVYVPASNGLIYIYDLQPMKDPFDELGLADSTLDQREKDERFNEFINSLRLVKNLKEPISIRAIGDLKVAPIVTRCDKLVENIAWPTNSQLLTTCQMQMLGNYEVSELYNFPLAGNAVSSLSHKPYEEGKINDIDGIIYAGTTEGFVYAIQETTGDLMWRFPTGEYVRETPVYADGDLFIATALSGMFCIDAVQGGDGRSSEAKWWSPEIRKFIACSKHRVYTLDKDRILNILDRATGQRIMSLPMMDYKFIIQNTQNDRIYFATENGLIQCVRETALVNPLDYGEAWRKAREERDKLRTQTEAAGQEAASEDEEAEEDVDAGDDDSGDDDWGDDDDDSGDDDDDSGDDDDDSGDDDDDSGDDDWGDDDDDSGDDDFGGDDDDDSGDDDFGGDDDDDSGDDDDDFGGEDDFGGDEEAEDEDF